MEKKSVDILHEVQGFLLVEGETKLAKSISCLVTGEENSNELDDGAIQIEPGEDLITEDDDAPILKEE